MSVVYRWGRWRVAVRVLVHDVRSHVRTVGMRGSVYRCDVRSVQQHGDTGRRVLRREAQAKSAKSATSISDAWGVRTKAAPGGQDSQSSGKSDGGIDAGEAGGGEPPRRLSGGRCGRGRRQSCAARWRRRGRRCSQSCGHQCPARCGAKCGRAPRERPTSAASTAPGGARAGARRCRHPATHGTHRAEPRRCPQPAQPARASEASTATSAARSAGARRTRCPPPDIHPPPRSRPHTHSRRRAAGRCRRPQTARVFEVDGTAVVENAGRELEGRFGRWPPW